MVPKFPTKRSYGPEEYVVPTTPMTPQGKKAFFWGVITTPFVARHPRLYRNSATWQKGSIRAEVLTRDWQPIPGFTAREARKIQGDALDHPVTWSNNVDLGKLLGQEIRLKFHMTRARIHAMTLSDDERPLGIVEAEYRSDKQGDAAPELN